MKFFHLSDLHIGVKLYNRDLSEDQRYVFERIAEYARAEQPDAIIIAGDIYDKAVPAAESVEMFDGFVNALTQAAPEAEIMMISGNHDSAPRINVFRQVLRSRRIHMIGLPPERPDERIERVTLTDEYGPVTFYLLPFVKPGMVRAITGADENGNLLSYDKAVRALLAREEVDTSSRNVLVSHQFYLPAGKPAEEVKRTDTEVVTVGNIDQVGADALDPFDYAALGHIHTPMQVGRDTVRYCGTPLAVSVSEAGQEKGIVCVEMGAKGTVNTRVLPLIPLRQVRKVEGSLPEVLEQASDDYITVVLTDTVDRDAADMQDRLRAAFPRLLEVRRAAGPGATYQPAAAADIPDLNVFDQCLAFLGDLPEEDQALLADIINTVKEEQA